MNIIILSEITLIDKLAEKIKLSSGNLIYFPLIKAQPLQVHTENILKKIQRADKVIFQSKNSVRYSNEFWNSVSLNKKVACFAVGKFTAAEVKKKIGVNCSYPQKHYSSEGLLEIAEMAIGAGENVVVMKGSGGRSLIEEKLSKRGFLVDSFDLYKRTKISFSPKEVPLDRNKLNYIVVLSKDSLDAFTDSFDPKITPYRLVFVAPQRILESHSLKKFSPLKTIIINKMDDAGSYFDVIEKYQRLNKST